MFDSCLGGSGSSWESGEIGQILSRKTNLSSRFISDYDSLLKVLEQLRVMGRVIVQTSGVFDILHSGHVRYLEEASKLGDVLLVGVDVDEWVRERKGKDRPVISFKERVEILAHLRCVGILTRQLGDLHKIILPDILVASESTGDLTEETKIEMREYCGRLVVFPAQSEIHSTDFIAKMKG